MTEKHEKAERAAIMRERGCSELEAVHVMAARIARERGNGIHIFLEIVLFSKARNSMIFGIYFEFAFFMLTLDSPRDIRQYTDGNFCLRENQWAKTSNR